MAEVEEPQFTSLSARIAALNQQGVGKSVGAAPKSAGKRPPPPLPTSSSSNRPALPSRGQTTNNPPVPTYGASSAKQASNQPISANGTALLPPPGVDRDQPTNTNNARTPPLPARRGPPPLPTRKDTQPSPALPARKSSTQMVRRGSNESTMSYSSTISGMSLSQAGSTSTTASSVESARKLPPSLDQTKLPPLPPTRREREQKEAEEQAKAKIPLTSIKSSPNIPLRQPPVVDRDLAPKMPPRPTSTQEEEPPAQPPRRLPPPAAIKSARSVLTMGFSNKSGETPNPGPRPVPTFTKPAGPVVQELTDRNFDSIVPPPINMSSKPSRSQVQAVQSRPAPTPPPTSGCLICRDFSGPDTVASQHPRHSLPQTGDVTGYLADVLCRPFTSATDKARAIFTWLHHNIAYDTAAFFGNRVKHVDPKDTIASGLAVCGGYAGVYSAVALKAGLEAVMVTGHGKGYGYTALQPGEPVPASNPTGHAWNAVRIDGGEWKLLDACWGAGNVGNQVYNKKFTPSYFTMSNDDFGLKHFPEDRGYFFRSDGRVPTWEEYYLGPHRAEPLQIYGAAEDHGLSPTSFSPPTKRIPINNETIRFQFSKVCEHWDHEKNGQGKPYPMILHINDVDGRKEDYVAFENNDFWYWADVPAKDLGAPGQKVSCYAVTSVNNRDARGMTRREYLNKKGKCAMQFGGVCVWELV